MRDANDMTNITQTKLQELVGHNARRITKPEQAVVCEDSHQAHSPRVQEALMAEIAQTCVAMHDLYLLTNENLPQCWE